MRIPLVIKIAAAIVALIALGLGLISYLGYARFVKVYRQIEDSRFAVVLVELKSGIELDLTLGLPLAELPNLGTVLADSRQLAAGINDLAVTDPDGRVLFSAPGSPVVSAAGLARIPAGWLNGPITDPDQPFRRFSDGDLLGLSAPIGDSFGRQVGAVVLTYRKAGADTVIGTVFQRLAWWFGVVFIGFAGMAAVAVRICFRPVGRSFIRMTEWLGETAPGVPGANDLERQVVAFRGVADTVRSVIRQASERLPTPGAWSWPALREDVGLQALLTRHGVATGPLYADPGFAGLIERGFRRFAEDRAGHDAGPVSWPPPAPPLVRALTDPEVHERLLDHGLDADDLLGDPALAALASGPPERKVA